MADYIDRQAAIDAVIFGVTYAKRINKDTGEVVELFREGNSELRKAAERIMELPSANAVEVVRCRDCKHRYIDGENVRYNVCDLIHNKVQEDDWFCADGERKDE